MSCSAINTYVQLVSVGIISTQCQAAVGYLPIIIDSFDNEAKCWTDAVHIFAHNFLDYGRFPCVVEATASFISVVLHTVPTSYSMRIRISLSFSLAFRKIDNIAVELLMMDMLVYQIFLIAIACQIWRSEQRWLASRDTDNCYKPINIWALL